MKIIAVGMNYALHNQELGHTSVNKEPVIFMKPDSAILKDGKPFFIPDFSNEVHYETELVVRINGNSAKRAIRGNFAKVLTLLPLSAPLFR